MKLSLPSCGETSQIRWYQTMTERTNTVKLNEPRQKTNRR